MDSYATHLPILKNIFDKNSIKNVFEFGCGNNSTLFFEKKCDEVIAIEMQNEDWYQEIKKKVMETTIQNHGRFPVNNFGATENSIRETLNSFGFDFKSPVGF